MPPYFLDMRSPVKVRATFDSAGGQAQRRHAQGGEGTVGGPRSRLESFLQKTIVEPVEDAVWIHVRMGKALLVAPAGEKGSRSSGIRWPGDQVSNSVTPAKRLRLEISRYRSRSRIQNRLDAVHAQLTGYLQPFRVVYSAPSRELSDPQNLRITRLVMHSPPGVSCSAASVAYAP